MADLVTLEELRTALGVSPTNTRDDAYYSSIIPAISKIIVTYTGRDFGTPSVTEEREFQYDGSGFLDIDDCTDVTRVVVRARLGDDYELDENVWLAQPPRRADAPVHYYIVLPTGLGFMGSPEMGFTRNLDVAYREGRLPLLPSSIKVTATWGWPDVPEDVKQAVYWTAQDWKNRNSGEGLTSEAIADYSRAWGSRSTGLVSAASALPGRAMDVLAFYQKTLV